MTDDQQSIAHSDVEGFSAFTGDTGPQRSRRGRQDLSTRRDDRAGFMMVRSISKLGERALRARQIDE